MIQILEKETITIRNYNSLIYKWKIIDGINQLSVGMIDYTGILIRKIQNALQGCINSIGNIWWKTPPKPDLE